MKITFPILSLCLAAGFFQSARADAIRYTITNVGGLGGTTTRALGVTDAGYVVGEATTNNNHTYGFIYNISNGTIGQLATISGGTAGGASAINASGILVGRSNVATNVSYHAVLYAFGNATDLGTFGGPYSEAFAINGRGDIAGNAGTTNNAAAHAFLRLNDGSGLTDLGTLGGTNSYAFGINAVPLGGGGFYTQVVGYSTTAGNQNHAFLYSGMTMTDLGTLGGSGSIAYDINDNGSIVGESLIANDAANHAFYRGASNTLQDLGTLGGGSSHADAINNAEQIVGFSETANGSANHAMLYENGVMRDLNTRVDSLDGWELNQAYAISEAGLIVGVGTLGGETRGFLLTPHNVPSPTVAIAGKTKVTTRKSALTVRGSAGGEVASVTYAVGKGAPQTAVGATAWSFKVKLKPGKSVSILVTAHGYGGDSAPAGVTLKRNLAAR